MSSSKQRLGLFIFDPNIVLSVHFLSYIILQDFIYIVRSAFLSFDSDLNSQSSSFSFLHPICAQSKNSPCMQACKRRVVLRGQCVFVERAHMPNSTRPHISSSSSAPPLLPSNQTLPFWLHQMQFCRFKKKKRLAAAS